MLLNETVPQWVIDITVDVSTTVFPSLDYRLDRLNSNVVSFCVGPLNAHVVCVYVTLM